MNPIERHVRNLVNPYSTGFSRWWCRQGRYLLGARKPPASRRAAAWMPPRPAGHYQRDADLARLKAQVMAERRAAIDALLADEASDGEDPR
jgi:hypothetical protein